MQILVVVMGLKAPHGRCRGGEPWRQFRIELSEQAGRCQKLTGEDDTISGDSPFELDGALSGEARILFCSP
jgi:hypothetical protein